MGHVPVISDDLQLKPVDSKPAPPLLSRLQGSTALAQGVVWGYGKHVCQTKLNYRLGLR